MINGIPHWIPPTWLDPEQTPQRNHTRHVERLLTPDTRLPTPPPNRPPETAPAYRPPSPLDPARQRITTRLAA
jgi:hypothetical protein